MFDHDKIPTNDRPTIIHDFKDGVIYFAQPANHSTCGYGSTESEALDDLIDNLFK